MIQNQNKFELYQDAIQLCSFVLSTMIEIYAKNEFKILSIVLVSWLITLEI